MLCYNIPMPRPFLSLAHWSLTARLALAGLLALAAWLMILAVIA